MGFLDYFRRKRSPLDLMDEARRINDYFANAVRVHFATTEVSPRASTSR